MKTWLLILSLGWCLPSAHATWVMEETNDPASIEPVTADHLRLLGKGLKNSHGESIALACVDEACNQLRFAYYRNPREVYFIGKTYQVKDLDEKQIEATIQESIKGDDPVNETVRKTLKVQEVFDWNHATQEEQGKYFVKQDRKNFLKRIGFLFLTLAGVAAGAAILILAPAASMLGLAVIIGSAIYGVKLNQSSFVIHMKHTKKVVEKSVVVKHRPLVTNYREMTIEVFNQDGWSWSSKPKKISDETFQKVFQSLTESTGQDTHAIRPI